MQFQNVIRIGAIAGGLGVAGFASGQSVGVVGGQTNVALDFDTLSAAASLDLSGVSGDVIAPGSIPDSVAFSINGRDAANLPTTFTYDPSDFLGSFAGTIEHSGSVFFNNDTVEVGNFTIGFDGTRAVGANSGFFVESTTGIAAILFDIGAPSTLNAGSSSLEIGADLLVSAEFGAFLFDNGLSQSNLAGADVGDALVQATVPAPGGLAALAGAGLLATRRRR
jgi:hypothetical protein